MAAFNGLDLGYLNVEKPPRTKDAVDRFPVPEAGLCFSIQRDLRGAQRLLGLWPLRRRAEAQCQRGVVAGYGDPPYRCRRGRLLYPDEPQSLGGFGPSAIVYRSDGGLHSV